MIMGTAGAQLITLVASPFIARFFTPEDFGIAALYLSIITLVAIPATFRFEHALVLPKSNQEALEILLAALLILLIISIVSVVVLFLYLTLNSNRIGHNPLGDVVYLIPIGIILTGLVQVLTSWATRKKKFRLIAYTSVWQSLLIACSRLISGLAYGSHSIFLVIGHLVGVSAKLLLIRPSIVLPNYSLNMYSKFKQILSRYKQFPLYSVPTGILRALNDNLPILMLSSLFEPSVVGIYAMSSRLIKAPVQMISEPIRLVYLQKLSEMVHTQKSVNRSLLRLTWVMFVFSLLLILPLVYWGEELFIFLLGEQWGQAGSYAAIISPWLATLCIQIPSSCLFVIYQKQKRLLTIQSIATVILLLSSILFYRYEPSIEFVLVVFSIIGSMLNLLIVSSALSLGHSAAQKPLYRLERIR